MRSIWIELQRRQVVRVAAVYAVVGWVVVEVAATTFPLLGLPPWAPTLVLGLALLGFPLALVLAWALELTPEGIRRTPPRSSSGPARAGEVRGRRSATPYVLGAAVLLLVGGAAATRFGTHSAGKQSQELVIGSVAVLPFMDLSPAGDQAHFGLGMAEELLDALAKVPGLNVTARTSSFQFRDRAVDIREVGRQLNVEAVIEGSIQTHGDRVRITAQLVKTSDGFHLWSERYDRELSDVFAVQDEISRSILLSIRPRLVGDTVAGTARVPTQNLEAYEEFLKASHVLPLAITPDDVALVITGLERAVSLDPGFALAWAALSEANQALAILAPPAGPLARAERAALRSVQLDPDLAEGYATLANLRHVGWEWDAATELYRRSIALNPTLAAACKCYGFHLMTLRQGDAAIQELERARSLDPMSPTSYTFLAQAYYNAGRLEDARAQVQHALSLAPRDPVVAVHAAWIDWADGRYDDALDRLTGGTPLAAFDVADAHPYTVAEVAYTLARAGRRLEAVDLLQRLERLAASSHVSPVWFAAIHSGLGDHGQALQWLDRAYRQRAYEISLFVTSPMSEPLQALPGYHDFLRRVGLGRRLEPTVGTGR